MGLHGYVRLNVNTCMCTFEQNVVFHMTMTIAVFGMHTLGSPGIV